MDSVSYTLGKIFINFLHNCVLIFICVVCLNTVHSGWEHGRAVPKGKSAVLNVEQEHERRRRLDDEYSAKLHRDRYKLFSYKHIHCISDISVLVCGVVCLDVHIKPSIIYSLTFCLRIREQAEANMANVQSTFELRAIKEAELANQKRELHHMALEDVRLVLLCFWFLFYSLFIIYYVYIF